MKIEGAIFDVDGTLLDSMEIWETVGIEYLKSKCKKPSDDLRRQFKAMSLMQAAEFCKGEYGLDDDALKIRDDINKMVEDYYFYDVLLKSGVAPFLEKLRAKGVKMCVATASDRYIIEAALKRNNILHYFDKVFTSFELGSGKDRPETFDRIASLLGVKKEKTVVFEDALYAAATAKKAGLSVVAVYDRFEENAAELEKTADKYVMSFDEIGDYFD